MITPFAPHSSINFFRITPATTLGELLSSTSNILQLFMLSSHTPAAVPRQMKRASESNTSLVDETIAEQKRQLIVCDQELREYTLEKAALQKRITQIDEWIKESVEQKKRLEESIEFWKRKKQRIMSDTTSIGTPPVASTLSNGVASVGSASNMSVNQPFQAVPPASSAGASPAPKPSLTNPTPPVGSGEPVSLGEENLVQAAKALFENQEVEKSLPLFQTLQKMNNSVALHYLGLMRLNGKGLPKDEKLAAKFFKDSADAGYAEAQFQLALMHEFGRGGMQKDDKAAFKYYKLSADQGNVDAACNLGAFYETGRGSTNGPNYQMAVKYYRIAADKDDGDALGNLAAMYENGRGVKEDINEAVKLYEKAAQQQNDEAQFNLAKIFEVGKGPVKPQKSKAIKYYKMADGNGYPGAKEALKRLGGQ
ncbi:hypothetical protein MP638_002756 [Amoeboaphelidium occidentale]|nr:hypothetical protein MP638_002756 [Amoeboaphelidium occidentale]